MEILGAGSFLLQKAAVVETLTVTVNSTEVLVWVGNTRMEFGNSFLLETLSGLFFLKPKGNVSLWMS